MTHPTSIRKRLYVLAGVFLTVILSISLWQLAAASEPVEQRLPNNPPFFSYSDTLNSNETVTPVYPQFGSPRQINFALTVTGTTTIDLQISDSGGNVFWSGTAEGGETLWGTTTLVVGSNRLQVQNTGSNPGDFKIRLYDISTTPYNWDGLADPAGLNSEFRLNFDQSGLYQFDFGVNTGARYEFQVDQDYIQKTVVGDSSSIYYVDAGIHTLNVVQNTAGGPVDWDVNITYAGQPVDSFPYEKQGDQINEEFLPVFLDADSRVNLVITTTATTTDTAQLDIEALGPEGAVITDSAGMAEMGETFWRTFDLPAGESQIHLTAVGGAVDYDLTMDLIPSTPYVWQGSADAVGQNSHARVEFPTSALYTFNYTTDTAGRYQFFLTLDDDDHIQKTVEQNGSVTYFVPAGTHDLYIDQDSAVGSDWSLNIEAGTSETDALPYAKVGGDIGGTGNDFTTEWLPISLTTSQQVNLSIETTGNISDSLRVEVYQDGSSTPDYTLTQALGTEKIWGTFPLVAGNNHLRIVSAGGNDASMTYDLAVEAVPEAGTATWEGVALDAGLNSAIMVDFPTTGLYRFTLNAPTGFANLQMDDALVTRRPSNTTAVYDVEVTAGMHELFVTQDPAYARTDWTASVEPAPTEAQFLTVDTVLGDSEVINQEYFVPEGNLEFNFVATVTGGDANINITDGGDTAVWSDNVLNGETVWGTGTLNGMNNIQVTNNGATDVNVEMSFFYLPTAGYTWDGLADMAGVNSHIRVNFDESGLYTFNLGADSGRYQFLINNNFVQKTVETDTAVTYYIPAGTHDLYIDQDTTAGANWDLTISDVGAADDSLPYTKMGGNIGGVDNDFATEWLPVNLGTDTAVNMVITVTGDAGDSLTVNVLDENGQTAQLSPVYGTETVWTTTELPANGRLQLVADGANATPLAYEVAIHPIPNPGYAWSGVSLGNNTVNSHVRIAFADSGLYTFNLGVDSGRYQLLVNSEYIQKTAETDTSVTYYIPAGTHNFYVDQDSTAGSSWNLSVSSVGDANDSLSYEKMGGEIGGTGNDFDTEWLPVNLGADTRVNVVITLTGNTTDSLSLTVWNTVSDTFTVEPLYGTEVVWASTILPGNARLNLTADGSNLNPMSYELAVHPIPEPAYTWSGNSLATGVNPEIEIMAPVDGLYRVSISLIEGFINFGNIDPVPTRDAQNDIVFDLPLTTGLHSVRGEQSVDFPVNQWEVSVTLLDASSPILNGISPNTKKPNVSQTAVITGLNFLNPTVALIGEGETYTMTVSGNTGTSITIEVPDSLPIGVYTVRVTNNDADNMKTAELPSAYRVENYISFLPTITYSGE